jgi:asparagine synthase (glutamine-hydrolysing)
MSAQAGIWNFNGQPVDRELLVRLAASIERYGSDGARFHIEGSIGMVYSAFHTTLESRLEQQPHRSASGHVLTWDGRLDNRDELIALLDPGPSGACTDVALVSLAFERWDTDCFARIVGDWAVAIWKPGDRELVLAVDYLAIRHLFYHPRIEGVWWSTVLTPLVLFQGAKLHIDEDYIAGYFARDPDANLTPYREMRQVPPGQVVRIRERSLALERYFQFSPKSRIRYKTDQDYEHHFRHLLRQSVRRRLRSDAPVLCELSGGLDSSSIVCMADDILAEERGAAPRLDTLSLYDKTEPDGDDWMYFQKVEEKRGQVGAHIDTSTLASTPVSLELPEFSALPGRLGTVRAIEAERARVIQCGGYRVVLSGLGGDEFMGGIPDPLPQLADLIVRGKLVTLGQQLIAWSLAKRRPWIQLLWQASLELLPFPLRKYFAKHPNVEQWIDKQFVKRTKIAARHAALDRRFRFCLPTHKYYLGGVVLMANKLAKRLPPALALEEARYPYLDRDLIEFILGIPANQLLRPGERRSLMRRALAGIVPQEILSRRTKQFAARTPILALEKISDQLHKEFHSPISSHRGYINPQIFLAKLDEAKEGGKIHLTRMMRTISLEFWLRALAARNLLAEGPGLQQLARRSQQVNEPTSLGTVFRHLG